MLNTIVELFSNSQSAIQLCKNLVFHERAKHVDVRYHFIRETISSRNLMRQVIFLHLYLRIIGIFESLCILVEQEMLLIRPHVFLVCDLQLPCSSSLQETFAEVMHPPTDSDE
ncbi:hypothetical protein AAG906_001336 [Vitis piasezkii]